MRARKREIEKISFISQIQFNPQNSPKKKIDQPLDDSDLRAAHWRLSTFTRKRLSSLRGPIYHMYHKEKGFVDDKMEIDFSIDSLLSFAQPSKQVFFQFMGWMLKHPPPLQKREKSPTLMGENLG